MVMELEAQEALTPAGNALGVPIPVAPVVAMVITELKGVLMQTVGEEEAVPAVFGALMVAVNVLIKV